MITTRITRVSVGLLVALLLVSSMPLGASRADATGQIDEMTISPTEKHFEADPGQEVADSFTVLNSGQSTFDFISYTAPYSVANGSYDAKYDPNAPRADAYKWVQMDKTSWHTNVRETVNIPYTIRIPTNASPGGHYGVIFAETQPAPDASGIVRKKRIGMVLYVNVRGNAVTNGGVSSIETPWFFSKPPIESTITVDDKGNTDFVATTTMTVSDLFGNKKFSANSEHNILPNTHRDIAMSWDNVPWFGIYKIHIEATVLNKTVSHDSYALITPYWLFLLIGVGIMLGAIDVSRRKKTTRTHRTTSR